jgi:hypothetical protein
VTIRETPEKVEMMILSEQSTKEETLVNQDPVSAKLVTEKDRRKSGKLNGCGISASEACGSFATFPLSNFQCLLFQLVSRVPPLFLDSGSDIDLYTSFWG